MAHDEMGVWGPVKDGKPGSVHYFTPKAGFTPGAGFRVPPQYFGKPTEYQQAVRKARAKRREQRRWR